MILVFKLNLSLIFVSIKMYTKSRWTLFVNKVGTGPAHSIWHVASENYSYPYQLSEPEHMGFVFALWLS